MTDKFDAFADFRMDGHNAVLTGGAQNIGAGIAKLLAGAGANVMVADLQGDKVKETAAAIERETGSRCMGMACNVTKADDIDALVSATANVPVLSKPRTNAQLRAGLDGLLKEARTSGSP